MTRGGVALSVSAAIVAHACRPTPMTKRPTAVSVGARITVTRVTDDPPPPGGGIVVRRQFARLGAESRPAINPSIFLPGAVLQFELFRGFSIQAVVRYVEKTKDSDFMAVASREGAPGRLYLRVRAGRFSATVRLPDEGDVDIEYYNAEKVLISQFVPTLPLWCGSAPSKARWSDDAALEQEDVTSQIDVGVMYTPKAACNNASAAQCVEEEQKLLDALPRWLDAASEVMTCSGVNARLNLVGNRVLAYPETGNLEHDLKTVDHPYTSPGKDLVDFRRSSKADAVIVIVSKSSRDYGYANIFDTDAASFADHATGVVLRAYAGTGSVLLHELAHIMGTGHQWGKGGGRHWYSHGNIVTTKSGLWYSVMATGDTASRNPALFSDPRLEFGSDKHRTGNFVQNNVKTLNKTRGQVELFQGGKPTSRQGSIPCDPYALVPTWMVN